MNTTSSRDRLIALFRSRLDDVRYVLPAMTVLLDDSNATEADLEIRHGFLRTDVTNAVVAQDLILELSDPDLDTIGKLADFINRQPGYAVKRDRLVDEDHPSLDLKPSSFADLLTGGCDLRHRRWSNSELYDLLRQGVQRHNVSYSPETVPENEFQFVLNLSHAHALRVLATNAVKRQGLESTVSDLISLAESYERAYRDDRKRQDRAIPVPEIRDDDVGEGDVVQGEMYRRSPRTGFVSPMSANLPPEPPVLMEPLDQDITDTSIRVRWKRPRDYDFYAIEVWRDTKEDVRRTRTGVFARNPTAVTRGEQFAPTTSKLVFQTFGANSNFDTVGFATFLEEFGQLITSFIDGTDNADVNSRIQGLPLEPNLTYYYRMYVVDLNYEIVDSMTTQATTKAPRARATPAAGPGPLSLRSGPLAGGTAVTMTGELFHAGMQVKLGDRFVDDLVIVSPAEATFNTPTYFNDQILNREIDLVVISDTGLEDIHHGAWRYTA